VRILCHAQHLSGIGHFVRMHAIAEGLAAAHEVHLVDGGRPVPRAAGAGALRRLELPRLARGEGGLCAEGADPVGAVLAERARQLGAEARRIRPDAVLVDHYPFSKWELEPEIAATVEAARRARPGVRVLSSLRDVVRRTRFEDVPEERFEASVLERLARHFDGILVHADPAFTRLEEHFGRAAELPVPVHYTGFVQELGGAGGPGPDAPFAVLSCGGGARSLPFLRTAIEAFRRLAAAGASRGMELHVFPGLSPPERESEALREAAHGGPIRLRAFSPDFGRWLAAAELSISRAGYNTTVQLLAAGTRAVVVPDPGMSDQVWRARRLSELGLAVAAPGDGEDADALAAALEWALARPRPRQHWFDLEGVAGTRAFLETGGEGA
jgi:predicted glycosyltransferase